MPRPPTWHRLAGAIMLGAACAVAVATGPVAGAAGRGHTGLRGHHRSKPAVVTTEHSATYGTILVTSSGRTLYLLTADKHDKSVCTASCAGLWPPFLSSGRPGAHGGLKSKLIGTIRRGARRQVTYDGHPLYLYSGDSGRAQVHGEGIVSFGGTWYVVGKGGAPVKAKAAGSTSGSSGSGGYGYGY